MMVIEETFAIVGAGKVGTAVGIALKEAGLRVQALYDIDHRALREAADLFGVEASRSPADAAKSADAIIITTPDDMVEKVCEEVALSKFDIAGKIFIHMSGALTLEALLPAARKGAKTLCIHPIQTFADKKTAARMLKGSVFGITASDESSTNWARNFVEKIGGKSLQIRNEDRVLYHIAAVIASNFLVMIEHAAVSVFEKIGVKRDDALEALIPLVRQTVDNIQRFGVVRALTGPLARGDVGTIKAHLDSLENEPELKTLYRAVSKWGLNIARERGELEITSIDKMARLL